MSSLFSLSPIIITAITAVVIMLITAFYRNHKLAAILSILGLSLAFVSVLFISSEVPVWAKSFVNIDNFSKFYMALSLAAAILINIISFSYLQKHSEQKEEYYILFNVSVLGTLVMISGSNFPAFFLGLELLSIPLYVMVAYVRNNAASIEASIKYLITAGASSAILLFGMALLYAATGTMDIIKISRFIETYPTIPSIGLAGIGLILAALGFKLAIAPFHMWTPDVYQGSPSPVTAFLASVAKAGAFVFAIRMFSYINIENGGMIVWVLIFMSVLSMFIGNLLALRQNSVKRILAFSSIAHFGYLLIALISGKEIGALSSAFYLTAYFITTVGAFAVISILSKESGEADSIDDFKGLYFKNKWLGIVLATMFFSLAGMPMTAGFIAKFYIADAAVFSNNLTLVWILIINSVIGLFYYMRVVHAIFKPTEESVVSEKVIVPFAGSFVLAIALLGTIWFGVAPAYLMKLINAIVPLL
jgi:NADH-quinone oxidoreductase subunit N